MVYDTVIDMLAASGRPFQVHRHPAVTTIAEAEATVPHLTQHLLKTVVFRIKDADWVLAAVGGQARIDYKQLAAAVGVKRTALRAMAPAQVEAHLGFEIGGVGPFPVRPDVRVIFDDRVLAWETIFCGSGRNTRTIEMRLVDLLVVSRGRVAPLRKTA